MTQLKDWILENPTIYSIAKFALIVTLVVLIIQFLRRYLKKNIPDTSARYKSQKTVEFIGYVLLVILSFSYFTGDIKDLTLAIRLFSASIAFTLQELILSIVGSIYIFVVNVYKPGDRIEINRSEERRV